MPAPVLTRLKAELIAPEKVVELASPTVKTDVVPEMPLFSVPPPESEATCWLLQARSSSDKRNAAGRKLRHDYLMEDYSSGKRTGTLKNLLQDYYNSHGRGVHYRHIPGSAGPC